MQRDWDSGLYDRFGDERQRAAGDLVNAIPGNSFDRITDLGCGSGLSTSLLAQRWPDARITAMDSSAAMLAKARSRQPGPDYVQGDIATFTPDADQNSTVSGYDPSIDITFTDTTNGYRAYSRRYLLDPRVQPFRDVFMRYELLFYLTARAGQIGMKVGHVPVRRRYPANAATPTKITGFGGKFDVLKQTFGAAFGAYHPKG